MAKRTKYAGANYDDDEKPIEIANDDFQDHEEVTRNNQRIAQERAARPNITTKPIGEEWNESEVKAIEAAAEAKRTQDAMKERVASAQKALGIYKPTKEERAAEQREAWDQHLLNTDERIENMRQNEEDRRDRWHSQLEDARDRRIKSVMKIAAAEPGRYGGIAHKAAVDYLQREEAARRFDTEQETTRKVSENEMNGKINYGKGAAEVKAGADITMNKNEWETRAKIAEQEAAAKKYLAEQDAATRKYGIDAEHGKIGEDGKVTPGSRERTAQIQGESEVQKQEAANKGLLAQAEITRQNKEKELATQIEKAQIAAGGKADSAKIASHAKIISAALQGGALQNKDAGTVLAELAEQYKNDPEMLSSIKSAGGGQQQQQQKPKEGDRMKFDDGWATFVPGKGWVKDAQ